MSSASKVSYFGPGPSKIPEQVLLELQKDVLEYEQTQVSILELSHRSEAYAKINQNAQDLLKELLKIPDNYKVLFLQGGAQCQLAAVPLNLLQEPGVVDYVLTGIWSGKAAKEGEKYGTVKFVLPKVEKSTKIPDSDCYKFSNDASYIYYCSNETIDGVEFPQTPKVPEGIPLVCDMTSNICTRPFDVSKYGVVFAGTQKNLGCAGITVVIVREDLIGKANKMCPSTLDYEITAKSKSIYNTPPVFAIYVLGKVLSWIKENGGVEGMAENSNAKSSALYKIIDSSNGFYHCPVDPSCRSRMNVVFRLTSPEGNESLEKEFIEKATGEGLLALKGHRWVGGIRVSLYNAITLTDAHRMCDFMKRFMERNAS